MATTFTNAPMITGGTGSFGNTLPKHFLTTDIGKIRVTPLTQKQDELRHKFRAK